MSTRSSASSPPTRRSPFAVDTEPVHCDGEEATKVSIVAGAVVDVGRRLAVWDAVDAGIFLCDRSVAETAEDALAGGGGKGDGRNGPMNAQGRPGVAGDIGGSVWIDVDTPEDVHRAER